MVRAVEEGYVISGNFGIILLRPSRIILFFLPLVKILNFGLPNELQNFCRNLGQSAVRDADSILYISTLLSLRSLVVKQSEGYQ